MCLFSKTHENCAKTFENCEKLLKLEHPYYILIGSVPNLNDALLFAFADVVDRAALLHFREQFCEKIGIARSLLRDFVCCHCAYCRARSALSNEILFPRASIFFRNAPFESAERALQAHPGRDSSCESSNNLLLCEFALCERDRDFVTGQILAQRNAERKRALFELQDV